MRIAAGRTRVRGVALALVAWGGLFAVAAAPQDAADDGAEAAATTPAAAPSLLDIAPEDVLKLEERQPLVPIPGRTEMQGALARATDWLVANQEADGSWGSVREPAHEFWSNIHTHKSWIFATTGLVLTSLLESREDDAALAACDRAVDFLIEAPPLKRPSDWDTDHSWGLAYGLAGVNAALSQPRYRDDAGRREGLRDLGTRCLAGLAQIQSSDGGWGYYDFDTRAAQPSWSTSFQTAVVVIAMVEARGHGLPVDDEVLARAVSAIERCLLPTGAYTYSVDAFPSPGRGTGINQVKGSLSRIQACNLALAMAGSDKVDHDDLVAGLDAFFEHHRFLDIARGKPTPHEAYYYNSGYFYFFGHYYGARVLERLSPAEQVGYRGRLAREIVKCQEQDGSMWDFYINTYHRPYGTAFGAMTLVRTLGREAP